MNQKNKTPIKLLTIMLLSIMITLTMNTMVFASTTAEKVTGVKQTKSYSSAVDISWTPQEDATYTVQISSVQKTWTTAVEFLAQANYQITGLTQGTDYYVRVQTSSSNADATSAEWSDIIHVATSTDSPTNLTQISATESSATFTWDATANADYYDVYITANGTETYLGKTTTPSYTATGLNNNTRYDFSVEAVTETTTFKVMTGKSTLLSEVINLVPGKIKNLSVCDTKDHYYNVEVTDENIYATEYEYWVYKYNKSKVITKWEGPASTALANAKLNSKTFYKIKARPFTYVNGQKAYGEWSDYTYFGLNLRLSASRTSDSPDIHLSWKKMSGAKNYTIYMSDKKNSKFKKIGTTKKNTYVIKNFKKKKLKSKKYYVYVVANGKYGKNKLKSTVPFHKLATPAK